MSMTMSVRVSDSVGEAVAEYMDETGWNRSSVIETALLEWLRLQNHPGIRFVTLVTGQRVAALVDGPEVWTVAESWMAHDPSERNVTVVAQATGLDEYQVEAALNYWADHREEIDAQVESIHRAQDRALAQWERRKTLRG